VTQERLNHLVKEKSDLRDTFESSILKLKDAHVKDMHSLGQEFAQERSHTSQLAEEYSRLRMEFEDKLTRLFEDRGALESSVQQCKKLNELQVDENYNLKSQVEEFTKENQMLGKEIKLMHDECTRLRMDNDDLRNSCIKLDKLV